jgi:ammonium transporter, Amt family
MKWTAVQGIWVVFAASMVLLAQAGYAAREAGLTRSKNAISVTARLLGGTLVGAILFWALGSGLLLGPGSGWLGRGGFFAGGAGGEPALVASTIFYAAVACAAASILSGAVAERMRLVPYLVMVAIFAALVFPLLARWSGAAGWLGQRGFIDFGGATTLHSLGGWLALAGIVATGAREGRFTTGQRPRSIPGSSIPLAALGVFILWLAFIGANTGPIFVDVALPRVLANLVVSAAAGGLVALGVGWTM